MLTNADCTIYEKDTFAPHVLHGVYWFDARGMTAGKGGMQIADSVLVYLYETDYLPKAGDLLVKGECSFAFDITSQQTVSESMKRFREAYPDFAVVKTVHDARYGGLPHSEVIAR